MLDSPRLGPGIYANIFSVSLDSETIDLMTKDANTVDDYEELKTKLESKGVSFCYLDEKDIFAHGANLSILQECGFKERQVTFSYRPRLTTRLILEGIKERVSPEFNIIEPKGRTEFVSKRKCASLANGQINLFRCYDARCIFLKDSDSGNLEFGLVVDMMFRLKSPTGEPLNSHILRQRYGSDAIAEVRRVQGDMVPGGRINIEISRQRLIDDIIPFIHQFSSFDIFGKVKAGLNLEPVRVTMGGGI